MFVGSTEEIFFFQPGASSTPAIAGLVLFANEMLDGVAAQGNLKRAARSNLALPPVQPVANGATSVYECDLVDLTGAAVPPSALSTMTLSVTTTGFNGTVINNVAQQNIFNTDRGKISAAGHLTITLNPADTVLSSAAINGQETRSMTIDLTWPGGVARHEVQFQIVGLSGQ